MKRIFFVMLICISSILYLSAQTYTIDTSEISFENKLRPCYSVDFDAPAGTAKSAWKDFLKKRHDIKVKGIGLFADKDLLDAEDVRINSVSDKRMNVYARITELSAGSSMKFFVSFGYDFFVGPGNYPQEFEKMKALLNDFCVEFLTDYYKDRVSYITKTMKRIEKDILRKQKDIEKNIKKAKKESDAVSLALETKNQGIEREIKELEREIEGYRTELSLIQVKQSGITRN